MLLHSSTARSVCLLVPLFLLIICNITNAHISADKYASLTKRWQTAGPAFSSLIWPQRQAYASLLHEFAHQTYVPASCSQQVGTISNALTSSATPAHWALKFLDSSGRGRAGMAYGYTSDVGNMDECITNEVPVHVSAGHKISGKYCLLKLNLPLLQKADVPNLLGVHMSLSNSSLSGSVFDMYSVFVEMMMFSPAGFQFGVCMPSACGPAEVERFLNDKLAGSELSVTFLPTCETLDTPIATHHWIAIILSAAYICFVIYATIVTRDSEEQSSAMEHFNFMLNTNKLLVETKDPLAKQISFFHGIRFFYQLAAIIFHTIDIFPFVPTAYAVFYVRDWPIWIFKQMYKSIGFFVQIPFAVSGFLTYVTMFPYLKGRGGRVSFLEYGMKRWFRSTPTMVGVIVLGFAWAGMGRGPAHRAAQEMTIEKCKTYWWANLLYINNFFHFDQMCLFHTWTYSSDFQCFLLSYFVIQLMLKDQQKAVRLALGLIIGGCLASGIVTYVKDMSPYPNFEATDARQYDLCTWFYFHTYHSVPSYFVGLLLAYCFLEGKKLDERLVWPGWIITFLLTISTGLIPYYVGFDGSPSVRWLELAHASLHRLFFISVWVYSGYLCCFNLGGYVQWLYEIPLWVPFGRMSSSVFLAHYTFIWFDLGNGTEYVSTRAWGLTMRCAYTVLFSMVYSYAVYLLFEAPAMSFFRTKLKKEAKTISQTAEHSTKTATGYGIESQISRRYSDLYQDIQQKASAFTPVGLADEKKGA